MNASDERHKRLHDEYFVEPMASSLEGMRAIARTKRHITFDCLNAIVVLSGVKCQCGHRFKRPGDVSGGGSASLLTILRGRSPQVCAKCTDYDYCGD